MGKLKPTQKTSLLLIVNVLKNNECFSLKLECTPNMKEELIQEPMRIDVNSMRV